MFNLRIILHHWIFSETVFTLPPNVKTSQASFILQHQIRAGVTLTKASKPWIGVLENLVGWSVVWANVKFLGRLFATEFKLFRPFMHGMESDHPCTGRRVTIHARDGEWPSMHGMGSGGDSWKLYGLSFDPTRHIRMLSWKSSHACK